MRHPLGFYQLVCELLAGTSDAVNERLILNFCFIRILEHYHFHSLAIGLQRESWLENGALSAKFHLYFFHQLNGKQPPSLSTCPPWGCYQGHISIHSPRNFYFLSKKLCFEAINQSSICKTTSITQYGGQLLRQPQRPHHLDEGPCMSPSP